MRWFCGAGIGQEEEGLKVLLVSKAQVMGTYHAKLRELASLGVELTVIVPPRWGKQELEVRTAQEYEIRVAPCALSGHNHFHFYRWGGPIAADLVHLDEEPWSLVSYQFIRACVIQQKPVLFFTWQNLYKRYPPPFNFFERFAFKHAQAAIAGNEEAGDVLRARQFVKPISVIPQFGVDANFFCRRNVLGLRTGLGLADKFVIGYVGRIVKEKGIADLIQALVLLPERCVLAVVGDGDFRMRAEQRAQDLGVAHRIRWIRQVSSFSMPEYMNVFDALILPSRTTRRWKEQFGRVLIEAMACETPVVGASSGEIPKVVGDAGFIFPEGDVVALAENVRRLCNTPGLGPEIGKRGRTRVLEMYTHQRIAEETVKFYREVLEIERRGVLHPGCETSAGPSYANAANRC